MLNRFEILGEIEISVSKTFITIKLTIKSGCFNFLCILGRLDMNTRYLETIFGMIKSQFYLNGPHMMFHIFMKWIKKLSFLIMLNIFQQLKIQFELHKHSLYTGPYLWLTDCEQAEYTFVVWGIEKKYFVSWKQFDIGGWWL